MKLLAALRDLAKSVPPSETATKIVELLFIIDVKIDARYVAASKVVRVVFA
jgi:hypothetical protein